MRSVIELRTADGICPTHVFRPDDDARWPGVIFFMDAMGVRPALFEMGERLAAAGYYVLMPDLYYRTGFAVPEGKSLFGDPDLLAHWKANVLPTVSAAKVMRDMPALLAHLDDHAAHAERGIGITGYCLGGRLSISAAGNFPDRVVAAAAYHPGGLATDAPDSPHLLARKIKARVYVGGAKDDSGFDDAQKARLERALSDAGVDHVIETYDAKHGWVPSDTAVHDPAEAERHWVTLLNLFRSTLA